MRFHARTAVAGLLSVALLAIFLRNANLSEVLLEIRRARVSTIALAFATVALTYLLRVVRWQYLLQPVGPTRFSTAFRTTVIGFAVTALLPGRAGEVLRPYLLARWEGLSFTATFATILLERLLDLVAVLALFASFLVLFDPGMAEVDGGVFRAMQVGGLLMSAAALAASAAVYVFASHPETLARATLGLERFLPPRGVQVLARTVRKFAAGFAAVRQPSRLLVALGLSLPLWLSIAAGIWLGARAFHITFPYTGSFLLMALLVVGVAVPTPGGVGGFHEAFRIGATAFYGAPNDRAIGAAIVLHALSFMPVAVLGIVFMAQAGLNLRGMRRLDLEDPTSSATDAENSLTGFSGPQADQEGGTR
jgi:uncharacterized protein (TIRG00374 family)